MTTRTILSVVVLVMTMSGGCATSTPSENIPEYLTTDRSCALLVAVGDPYQDKHAEEFWFAIKKQIVETLQGDMSKQYRSVLLLVEPARAGQSMQMIGQTAARNQCNRVLQLTYQTGEDAQGKFIEYGLNMFRAVPVSRSGTSTRTTMKGEYARTYRIERNLKVLEKLLPDFAHTVFADLEKSGALEPLRR